MRISNAPKKPGHRGRKRMIVLIALLAVIAGLFADSNFRIVSTEYELYYGDLPQSFDGYRVVQVSDLHMSEYGKNNARLLKMIKAEEPDIIAITGDLLIRHLKETDGEQTEKIRPFLEELVKIAPCYFISGNHEWASGEIRELKKLLDELGVRYLRNEFVLLERGGDSIVLAGVEDPNGPIDMMKPDELAKVIADNYPGKYVLMLAHRNDFLKKYPDLPVDTILCGHSHGGIVRLPFIGGILGTDRDLFPKYDAGIFNEGTYDMVVSRGLGGQIPRFLNNPELVTVILKKS